MSLEILSQLLALWTQVVTSTVFLEQANEGLAVCRVAAMAPTNIKCTTTTPDGFLTWRNSSGAGFSFGESTSVTTGTTGTLGSTIMTLNNIEHVSNAVVYTSTASENMTEDTTIQCSDGGPSQSINITVKSPSSPSWPHSACRFSQGSVRLSWNPPVVAPECCNNYTVQLSTGSVSNITKSSVTVPIGDEAIDVTVYCLGDSGEKVTKSGVLTINLNTVIERITIEPQASINNSVCDGDTIYQISWITNTSSQDVCIPPVTNVVITCITSSTQQMSMNALCFVPATETITVNITIVNAAGYTSSKSASSDVLAQVYRRLCTPSSQVPTPPPTEGAVIIIMVLFVFLLTVVSIVLTVYIMRNRMIRMIRMIRIKKPPKESYTVNFKAVNKTAQEKKTDE